MSYGASDVRPVARCPRTILGVQISRLLNSEPQLPDVAIASRLHTTDLGYIERLRYFHNTALSNLTKRKLTA